MTKSIEQIKNAAEKALDHYQGFGFGIRQLLKVDLVSFYVEGFDVGARAGYLKAIEVLRGEREEYPATDYCKWLTVVIKLLESKIDEVLGK